MIPGAPLQSGQSDPLAPLRSLWEQFLALPDWQGFVVAIVASVAVAFVIQKGGDPLIARVTSRIEGEIDDIVLGMLHPPLYVTVVLLGLYVSLLSFGFVADNGFIRPDWEMQYELQVVLISVLTLLWSVTLVRIGGKVSDELTGSEHVESTVIPIFQNVWSAIVIGLSLLLLLLYWEVDVTPLLASAGILGIVIGFAAKDTVANFFGSIALYLDGTYTVGDFVVLESGVRGRVEDVSIRSTVIRTRDDILITVPNSVLNSAQITNESTPGRERRIRIPVGVAYGSDLDYVEEALLEVADEEPSVLDAPSPRVRVRGFGDSAIDVELLCWIPAPVLRGRATHNLNKAVYAAFTRHGIEIPFPQRDVHVARDDTPIENPAPVPDDREPTDDDLDQSDDDLDSTDEPTSTAERSVGDADEVAATSGAETGVPEKPDGSAEAVEGDDD